MSEMDVVGPNKSLLAEQPDPILVPDLERAQTTGQGSTHHENETYTHTLCSPLLSMNQQLFGSCCRRCWALAIFIIVFET